MLLQRIKMQKSKTAYEAALHLLKYRGQSTYELRKKLKDREYPLREIEEALSKLLHYGYVNDLDLAEDLFNLYKSKNAYGDVYKASEMKIPGKGKAEIVYTAEDGTETRELIHEFDGPGIVQGMHNLNGSIDSFARSCFNYALETHQDLWFATKDTISKKYDHTFKDIFQDIYDADYKEKFEEAGIEYFYTLIDDAVARVIRSEGGYIWACKNYDGDVMSDMVATAFGSLAMMTSVLVAPDGTTEYEAAHGTVQRHYYKHLKGEETSTNSVATIFAWSGALRKRGKLDGIDELVTFADKLEKATIDTIESGTMTKDLALITTLENVNTVNSEDFIKAIRATLENLLNA